MTGIACAWMRYKFYDLLWYLIYYGGFEGRLRVFGRTRQLAAVKAERHHTTFMCLRNAREFSQREKRMKLARIKEKHAVRR